MKERPIPLKAWEVQAILAGRKTQTRRMVKPQPIDVSEIPDEESDSRACFVENGRLRVPARYGSHELPCPYGQPGDRLWVKETWRAGVEWDDVAPRDIDPLCGGNDIWYAAQGRVPEGYGRLRASIHTPRWASRILLEVVSVRVERVQSISDTDLCAEGYEGKRVKCCPDGQQCQHEGMTDRDLIECGVGDADSAVEWYADLWDSINGDGSWEENSWVWVVEFKVLEAKR